ncbi:UNVERIFIED_CONTAM: hypothetical protein K2H54_000245 [Gekko kuhli]
MQPLTEHDTKIVSRLLEQLKAVFPAWQRAYPTEELQRSALAEWTRALVDAGCTSREQLQRGMRVARSKPHPWIPSTGEFIQWCQRLSWQPGHELELQTLSLDAYRPVFEQAYVQLLRRAVAATGTFMVCYHRNSRSIFHLYYNLQPPLYSRHSFPSKEVRRPSAELLDLIKLMLLRQEWYRDHVKQQLIEPNSIVGSFSAESRAEDIVRDMRVKLGVPEHPLRGSWEDYYRDLVSRIESCGILVMRQSSFWHHTRPCW